jgi:hypothetical protein
MEELGCRDGKIRVQIQRHLATSSKRGGDNSFGAPLQGFTQEAIAHMQASCIAFSSLQAWPH